MLGMLVCNFSAVTSASAETNPPAATMPPRVPARDLTKYTLPAYLGPLPRARPGPAAQPATLPPVAAVPASAAAKLGAATQRGRADVPRVELAARLAAAGLRHTDEYARLRADAARELAGRGDGEGAMSAAELKLADETIARGVAVLQGTGLPPATLAELARRSGRPQLPGLRIVYLHPLGHPAQANDWKNILVHQTEGPTARPLALAQAANPTKRGATLWVETDGTVYWSTAENAIPTHGDGANRNDNRYINNSNTYRKVIKTNSIGVEFAGNFPNVAKPATAAQVKAWLILVRFLQERYRIAPEHIYAHNWIDYKDHRYCEGCELATLARKLAYRPGSKSD